MSLDRLHGTVCTRLYQHYPGNFTFEFEGAALAVDCLWRIMAEGKVVLTSRDHDQQFGVPAAVDVCADAVLRLQGHRVVDVWLDEKSADLRVIFEGGQRLEILTDSSGYEPWNFRAPGVHLVGLGGGGVANFSRGA